MQVVSIKTLRLRYIPDCNRAKHQGLLRTGVFWKAAWKTSMVTELNIDVGMCQCVSDIHINTNITTDGCLFDSFHDWFPAQREITGRIWSVWNPNTSWREKS